MDNITKRRSLKNISQEAKDNAVERYLSGESLKAICDELGISSTSFYDWLRAAGFTTHRSQRLYYGEIAKQEILDKYRAGETADVLCEEYKMHKNILYRWVNEAGIPWRGRSRTFSEELKAEVLQRYLAGESSSVLCREYQMGDSALYRWLRKANIPAHHTVLDKQKQEIISRYQGGESASKLREEYGVSTRNFTRWLNKAGIYVRGRSDSMSQLALEALATLAEKIAASPDGDLAKKLYEELQILMGENQRLLEENRSLIAENNFLKNQS